MIIVLKKNRYKVLRFQLLKKMTFCSCGHKITTNTRLLGWALRFQQAIIKKLKYNFNHMYTKHELWTFIIIQLTQTCTRKNIFTTIKNEIKWTRIYDTDFSIKLMLICLKTNFALAWFTPIWFLSCRIFHKIIIVSGIHASFERSWIGSHVCTATLLMNIFLSLTIWNLGYFDLDILT